MCQLADHPDRVLIKHAEEVENNLVCALCDEEVEEAIKSRCHHSFCRLCVTKYINSHDDAPPPECPQCHIPLIIDVKLSAIEADFSLMQKHSIINRIDMLSWRSSTKIEAHLEELYKSRPKNGLSSSMSPTQREATIKHFMENVEVAVFLVGLKAGGVALNLIEVSQAFFMDTWWNPSVEWQAANRIHSIGQNREKKAQMIQATVGGDSTTMDRLTPSDMQCLFQN
ncbi:DNA repair protein rad16 [Rhizina undulata]